MTDRDDPLGDELRELPVPPLDPALDAAVQRRARAAFVERPAPRSWWQALVIGWQNAAVPAVLVLSCAAYVLMALRSMLRAYVG